MRPRWFKLAFGDTATTADDVPLPPLISVAFGSMFTGPYIESLEDAKVAKTKIKPMVLVVLTDGRADDSDLVKEGAYFRSPAQG